MGILHLIRCHITAHKQGHLVKKLSWHKGMSLQGTAFSLTHTRVPSEFVAAGPRDHKLPPIVQHCCV